MKLKDLFKQRKIRACFDGLEWLGDRTLSEMWAECERSDWMLWTYQSLYPENYRELVLAAGHCAHTVRHLMQDKRSQKAVDSAIAFGEGKISKTELKKIADDARVADIAAADAHIADNGCAINAAACACAAACVRISNAQIAYAAYTAYTAAHIADDQKQTADICRKYLSVGKK